MDVIQNLVERNQVYAESKFASGLRMMPSLKTTIIGCVDPRVDPFDVLGLEPGEAAVIRNVGGRIYPSTLQTMAMLRVVAEAQGGVLGAGWNLIVLHHTDCGINCLGSSSEALANHFGIGVEQLGAKAIDDPRASVAHDVALLKTIPQLPAAMVVSGLVYDVSNGRVEVVVPPTPLR